VAWSVTRSSLTSAAPPTAALVGPGAYSKERRAATVNFRQKEKQILDTILGQGKYDRRIRPSGVNDTGKSMSSREVISCKSALPLIECGGSIRAMAS